MGFALYVMSVATLPLAESVPLLVVPLIVFGVANGVNVPSILTLLTNAAPTEFRGAFMAVNGMLLRLGQTLGPIVVGVAFDLSGLTGAFVGSAALAAVMGIVLFAGLERAGNVKR